MSELVQRLRVLDTCAVSDALDALGLPGPLLGLQCVTTLKRMAGAAVTVKLGADDGRASRRHLCTAAVEAAGADTVIVIEHGGRTDVAGWGGILSQAAVQRGVEGVVIDGACRDADESRQLNFPVFARGAVPVTARGRIIELEWDTIISVAGRSVAPGDLVLADGSGVVVVPIASAEAVVAKAETIAARERLMAADIKAGRPVSEVMGASYEDMLKGNPS